MDVDVFGRAAGDLVAATDDCGTQVISVPCSGSLSSAAYYRSRQAMPVFRRERGQVLGCGMLGAITARSPGPIRADRAFDADDLHWKVVRARLSRPAQVCAGVRR